MIATDAPSSAAARAARCPARPAPMIRTSCAGMGAETVSVALPGPTLPWRAADRPARRGSGLGDRVPDGPGQGAADLLDRDHAAQPLLGVDDHERAHAPQR